MLELKPLIYKINGLIVKYNIKENYNYNSKKFKKAFDKITHIYHDKKIFVVYLPETSCFQFRSEECKKRFDHLKNSSEKITFLSFYDFVINQKKDYKKMYALGQDGSHFSTDGYSALIKFIDNKISLEN